MSNSSSSSESESEINEKPLGYTSKLKLNHNKRINTDNYDINNNYSDFIFTFNGNMSIYKNI